jgi:hypothetical protein
MRTATVAFVLMLSAAAADVHAQDAAAAEPAPIAPASIHLSAAGTLVDVRYRVLDPVRAQQALGPKIRPKLIDEHSGIEMSVPMTAKLGALRQTQARQQTGRTYFVLFVNSAGVRSGSRVTMELGELKFPGLIVE